MQSNQISCTTNEVEATWFQMLYELLNSASNTLSNMYMHRSIHICHRVVHPTERDT